MFLLCAWLLGSANPCHRGQTGLWMDQQPQLPLPSPEFCRQASVDRVFERAVAALGPIHWEEWRRSWANCPAPSVPLH